ncbi:MAG TPA: hypothetical protein VG188_05415 [Solirubrobacteraceae bacterium]|jgi:hypothetical protein|nr:hypothetical protein [Solirubrobacteraceae bacterium]
MSTDPTAGAAGAPAPGEQPDQPGQPSEEELRAAYEAELSRITSADMMLQAAVSLLNIGSFRLAPKQPQAGAEQAPSARAEDLEQVRDAIDGVRALLEILERRIPGELRPLRDALSQLQMAYAREAQAGGAAAQGAEPQPSQPAASESQAPVGGAAAGAQGQAEGPPEQGKPGPGPAESSGRLWVPGR